MSIFYCLGCDSHIDSDFVECHEDPKNDCELLCTDCYHEEYTCGECEDVSEELVSHPCDRTQSFKVCPSCSEAIIDSYEFQEVQSARSGGVICH